MRPRIIHLTSTIRQPFALLWMIANTRPYPSGLTSVCTAPPLLTLTLTHIFADRRRAKDLIHGGEIAQTLEAPPEHDDAGGTVPFASQETA